MTWGDGCLFGLPGVDGGGQKSSRSQEDVATWEGGSQAQAHPNFCRAQGEDRGLLCSLSPALFYAALHVDTWARTARFCQAS